MAFKQTKLYFKEGHDMDNIIEATEYCLTKGKCTNCKFSKGKMFATCRYLVEDMSKLLKESKKGRWIPQPSNKEQGEWDCIWWKCSECGNVIISKTSRDREEFHRFCGRCGARMN